MSEDPESNPQDPNNPNNPSPNLTFNLGALALKSGIIGLVFNPIFRSKIIMQTQGTNPQVHSPFKGILNTMRRVTNEQGFHALWRGSATSMLVASLKFPIRFVSLMTTQFYAQKFKQEPGNKAFWSDTLVMFLGTMTANSIVHPLDVARTKIWTDMTQKNMLQRKYTGLWDCLNKVYQANGMAGLYKGYSVSLVYIFTSLVAFNGIYDGIRPYVIKGEEEQKLVDVKKKVLLSLGTIVAAVLVSYPIDTVMQRMIMQADRKDAHYKNVADCLGKMSGKEGVRAFYGGVAVAFLQGLIGLNQFLLQKEGIGMVISYSKEPTEDE